MIHKKEFYFVRHGQTDHNVGEGSLLVKGDHPLDISLNATGRSQALAIEPVIAQLPVQAVFASPLQRVKETREIITPRLNAAHVDVHELGECSAQVWHAMTVLGMYATPPNEGIVFQFMERVKNGINHALLSSEKPLIVAHGGVHWALCCLLGIRDHQWAINNCVPVHFYLSTENRWAAKILKESYDQ